MPTLANEDDEAFCQCIVRDILASETGMYPNIPLQTAKQATLHKKLKPELRNRIDEILSPNLSLHLIETATWNNLWRTAFFDITPIIYIKDGIVGLDLSTLTEADAKMFKFIRLEVRLDRSGGSREVIIWKSAIFGSRERAELRIARLLGMFRKRSH